MNNTVSYEISKHKEQNVIFIRFAFSSELNEWVRSLTGAKWSQTQKAWYVLDNKTYREKFGLPAMHVVGKEALGHIHEVNRPAMEKYIETLQLKAYSPNTITTYRNEFGQLLQTLKDYEVDSLDAERLRSYFLYCVDTLKLSENTLHSRMNAIKFYFEQVLKHDKIFIDIPRPKKPSTLPKNISTRNVKKLFEVTSNLKHNLMLKLCYGMGLRLSEIVNLKITDIDSISMQVLIEQAEGKKDRYVNLPETILEQLQEYYKAYNPQKYLFEGKYGDKYSIRSAQQVFKIALKKAKIKKKVGIHGLKHSFATHLLENGTDIKFIEELLGHNDIKTTLHSTQVSEKKPQKNQKPVG